MVQNGDRLMLKACFSSPKLKALQSLLQCGFPQTIGLLELLWNFTGQHSPQGNIGKWSDVEIAGACEWDGDPEVFVQALVTSRFLDAHPHHRLVVHDWEEHCPRWVKAVVKKLELKGGEGFIANGDCSTDYRADYRAAYESDCNELESGMTEPTVEATLHPTPPNPSKKSTKKSTFQKPTVQEVAAYCRERRNGVDPEQFWDHHEARDWKLNRGVPMKDWKAAVRTWERNSFNTKKATNGNGYERGDNLPVLNAPTRRPADA